MNIVPNNASSHKPTEIAAGKGPVAMFPIAFGAITVAYNLPGIKTGQIKPTGDSLQVPSPVCVKFVVRQ